MSYTTGTTHYNLPQTVGSDKRDWFDTNEAFAEVDTALYGAVQDTAQAGLDITDLKADVVTINGKLTTDEGNITTLQGKVSTLEGTVASQGSEITDVRRDLQDNIESSHEATATSTHTYAVGDYFFYNDVLYKATAIIGVGDTIVPNTNCTGVTVMSEMENGGASPDASQVSYDNTTSGLTADDVQEAIDELADEKIDTFSGSVQDADSNTYTAVTADGIAYDSTNEQLLLKVNGADTVIPFKKAGEAIGAIYGFKNSIYGIGTDGVADSHTGSTMAGTLVSTDFADIVFVEANEAKVVCKKAGYYGLTSLSEASSSLYTEIAPTLKAVNDEIRGAYINQSGSSKAVFSLVYFGDTNPFA